MVELLPIPTERFCFSSSVEVPLTVDAADLRAALCIGLQLLEREEIVARLRLRRTAIGMRAFDPATGEVYEVQLVQGVRARQAA